jgi:predicted metalloprotease with PDZ domain
VRLTTEKVAGGSFEEFFEKYISSAEALPYERLLPLAGLALRTVERRRADLGFSADRDASELLVVSGVDPDGGAAAAGLLTGDVIVSWNGSKPPQSIERWVYSQKKGSLLRLGVRRDEKNVTLEFRLGEATETLYRVAEDAHASEKGRRIREGLLRGVTQPVTASMR